MAQNRTVAQVASRQSETAGWVWYSCLWRLVITAAIPFIYIKFWYINIAGSMFNGGHPAEGIIPQFKESMSIGRRRPSPSERGYICEERSMGLGACADYSGKILS
jgi:hypothetical protein